MWGKAGLGHTLAKQDVPKGISCEYWFIYIYVLFPQREGWGYKSWYLRGPSYMDWWLVLIQDPQRLTWFPSCKPCFGNGMLCAATRMRADFGSPTLRFAAVPRILQGLILADTVWFISIDRLSLTGPVRISMGFTKAGRQHRSISFLLWEDVIDEPKCHHVDEVRTDDPEKSKHPFC